MNPKYVQKLLALRSKKKKTDKGQIRLDRGSQTNQGHLGIHTKSDQDVGVRSDTTVYSLLNIKCQHPEEGPTFV